MKKRTLLLLSIVLIAAMFTGCGKSGGKSTPEDTAASAGIPTDPVTLKMFRMASVSDEINQVQYIDVIKKKYPFITLEVIPNVKGTTLPELLAADRIPDIIIGGNPKDVQQLKKLDLAMDMTPLMKKHKFDIGRIEPAALEMVKKYGGDDNVYALPESVNYVALYYNKDIFDRFGVPYPKDGMTWTELLDVAKRVTRTENNVTYRGFDFQHGVHVSTNQLSLSMVDNKTDKALVNTSEWKNVFDTMKAFYAIPGNEVDEKTVGKEMVSFVNDRTLAMISTTTFFSKLPDAVASGLNFDLVSMPSFPQAPKTGTQSSGPILSVTSTSKYKDQAFAVVAELLSDDGQMSRSVNGRAASVVTPELKKRYGENLPYLKGKNISAFTANKIAPAPKMISNYDQIANTEIVSKFRDVILGKKDVNTALREAEEVINKKISEEKAK